MHARITRRTLITTEHLAADGCVYVYMPARCYQQQHVDASQQPLLHNDLVIGKSIDASRGSLQIKTKEVYFNHFVHLRT